MKKLLPTLLLLSSVALAQTATPPPAAAPAATAQDLPDAPSSQIKPLPVPNGPTAVFDTSLGRMTCQFFQKETPVATANFIALAEGTKDWADPTTHRKMHNKPLYNNTTFHRVIPGFMAQGGDPTGTGMGDAGYYFPDETRPDLGFEVPGRLAMANSGPNTNSTQFFITEAPVEQLNGGYTLFGQCDPASVFIVRAITHVERDSNDKPLTPVVLKKVTIVREGQPMPPLPPAAAEPAPATVPATPARPRPAPVTR